MAEALYPAKLSEEKERSLKSFLKYRILELKQNMKQLYEEKIIKWRAAYDATPAVEEREFPFQGASNLIIPIIGIHVDTLHAQIMAAIFKTEPIVVAKVLGEQGPMADEFKEAYEAFMQYMCIEPKQLDLYRVYNETYRECIKYGTATIKCPWEHKTRDFLIPGGDGTGSARDFYAQTLYDGPRPEKLPFTSFYMPPMTKTLEAAEIKAHKRTMLYYELQERKFTDIYNRDAVDSIINRPDRTGPTMEVREKEDTLGAKTTASYGHREWDVWECFVTWRYEDEAFAPRMIASYHELTDTILRVMWDNFVPEWFIGARLAYRDDMYWGQGYCEIVLPFQEGGSNTYNGYRDNQTVANTRVWRVSPDSKLNEGYRIYPSCKLPAEKDEIEALAHGDVGNINLDELRLLLELAERRSGVSPPQQGMGAGVTTGKRGIYSAMGTLSLLQEGNSRKDLNISDMRDAHVRLMRQISHQYGTIGMDSKLQEESYKLFGKKGPLVKQALKMIVSGDLGLPVYASTASLNKEVEKQNDVMLTQIMARHYQMIAQLLGSMQQMMTPPQVKQYFAEVILASNLLMKKILRNFGHDEVDRLVPDPSKYKQPPQQPQGGGPGGPQQGAGPGAQPNPEMAGGPGGQSVQ